MKIIESIHIFGVGLYKLGDKIKKIEDNSVEFENSIDIVYIATDENGEILHEFINCPMVVNYKDDIEEVDRV